MFVPYRHNYYKGGNIYGESFKLMVTDFILQDLMSEVDGAEDSKFVTTLRYIESEIEKWIKHKKLEERPETVELFKYIEKQGYRICGPTRRQYVEGAWNQKDPEKWLTIYQVPIEKVNAMPVVSHAPNSQ